MFKGSALAFRTEFLGLRRELDVCGATMQHYSLCRLMRAFDGKSRNLQYKIAEDFNECQIEQANIYDLLQKYCSFLASVGDGTSRPVNTAVCHHCNADGHRDKRPDCPKLKVDKDKAEKKKKNDDAKREKKNKDKKIVMWRATRALIVLSLKLNRLLPLLLQVVKSPLLTQFKWRLCLTRLRWRHNNCSRS